MIEFEFTPERKYSAIITFFIFLSLMGFGILWLINEKIEEIPILIVVIFATVYFAFIFRTFLFYLFGKENITITESDLIISKKETFFTKQKTYKLFRIKNLRIENRKYQFINFFASRTRLTTLKSYGCLVFNYENKVVNFGSEVENHQTKEILRILQNHH